MEIAGREGAKVVGTARTESKLQEGLDAVKAAGGDGIIVPADLEEVTSQDRVVQAALDAFGRVDVLINNAGVGWQYGLDNPGTMGGIHEASLDNWRAIIGGVDLEGYFLAIRAVLPKMIEQNSGSIVNVSSMAGITGLYDAHAYTAAKGAIVNMTRSMAISYAKHGVRTNCVCPGFIDTPMIAPVVGAFDDPAVASALTPMGRPGRPEEIANTLIFLASEEASYCNGSVLVVDGGCTSRSFVA
jgi:NAD(P)-dependent dehydrogenase (short-subunit alcohol dehydrogenase family)